MNAFLEIFSYLFRNHFYYNFMCPKINKRGVGIRAGGWIFFSKINKRGNHYSVFESTYTNKDILCKTVAIVALFDTEIQNDQ